MKVRKHAWNCAGSSSRNTRENVSWLGMPCRSVRTSSRKVCLARPNRTMSVQVSPPHNRVNVGPGLPPAKHGAKADEQDLQELVTLGVSRARILQVRENRRKLL